MRDAQYLAADCATGNGIAIMSNRISYFFDIHGPSMTIDTGCSASLICIHQAVQSLLSGESSMVSAAIDFPDLTGTDIYKGNGRRCWHDPDT